MFAVIEIIAGAFKALAAFFGWKSQRDLLKAGEAQAVAAATKEQEDAEAKALAARESARRDAELGGMSDDDGFRRD